MKLNGNAVKPGNVIEHNGRLWTAVKVSHVKPGKGGAFAQIELRDIRDGTKLNERFRSSETVERVILDEIGCTFLYEDGETLVFMHPETFEQISIPADMVGERAAFLQDGMTVTMSSHEGEPISVELPDTVVMEVVEADAVVKGQTASSSYKPAVLENGVRVMVPPHIETGTRIVVRPEDNSYVERAKVRHQPPCLTSPRQPAITQATQPQPCCAHFFQRFPPHGHPIRAYQCHAKGVHRRQPRDAEGFW